MNTPVPPAAQSQDPNLPMFYKAPRPLDRTQDRGLRLSRTSNFKFTSSANAIPLLVDEFPMAAAYYPIVFAGGPTPVPAVVVGLHNDENLMVNASGEWLAGTYLPSYVRRYPFILMDDDSQKQFVLCIDGESDMLNRDDGFELFENDEPSEFTKSAMEFCAGLRAQGDATDEFVRALTEYDLLTPNDAQIDVRDGTHLQLSGFLVISPEKFDALPDSVIIQWRKKGWLGLVYAQLLSSHRWQNLVDLLQAKP